MAEKEGFTKFVSVQGHYNLIFREEEREMAPYCREENIAMTPYSALAGGRLSKRSGETSKRLQEDSYAQLKYGAAHDQDAPILTRVAELADYNLYIAANESLFRNGAMSSRIAQLNVVDILYTAYASRHYEETLRALTRTHIYKPGEPEEIIP